MTNQSVSLVTSKAIKARDLKEGYSIKIRGDDLLPPGAPARSTIRSANLKLVEGGVEEIVVKLDWGTMVYHADESVEIEAVSLVGGEPADGEVV